MDNNFETNTSYYQENTTPTSESVSDNHTDKVKNNKVKTSVGILSSIGAFAVAKIFGLLGVLVAAIAAALIGVLSKTKLPLVIKIILDVLIVIVAIVLYFVVAIIITGA